MPLPLSGSELSAPSDAEPSDAEPSDAELNAARMLMRLRMGGAVLASQAASQAVNDTESDSDSESEPEDAQKRHPAEGGGAKETPLSLAGVTRQSFIATRASSPSRPALPPALPRSGPDVGMRARVLWVPPSHTRKRVRMSDLCPYFGTVVTHTPRGGPGGDYTHLVLYDDGCRRWHNVRDEKGLIELLSGSGSPS